jgi:pyruvate,orthophosphate dikinase
MVFGNWGESSATGVAMSRNATTGENQLEGDFLVNAQGEDVVAGIRLTQPLDELRVLMPDLYAEFAAIARKLEQHYRDMQDMEFTIEHGKLWILQTRDGKRTAQAAVQIAVDLAEEGLIDRAEAVLRVKPEQIDFFMHPRFAIKTIASMKPLAYGLNVSPGAAVGKIALDADTAEAWANAGETVIMVRPETKPDDVHGMLAAAGILTSRGGRTSHAALVARQFGKPAVVGVAALDIDFDLRTITLDDVTLAEGEMISLDGGSGAVYHGTLPTETPDISNPYLLKILGWADDFRKLHVWANADYPRDAERAREYGAEGIGLCRTEHMFFETERLPIMQSLIMAQNAMERKEALDALLPIQQADFEGIFRAMDGLPVVIRLIDPPLHEFLPSYDDLVRDLADLKVRLQHFHTLSEIDAALAEIRVKEDYLTRVMALREANPMLGTRGVRLGVLFPELVDMQVRAIFTAACHVAREGFTPKPEVMIPLTSHVDELIYVKKNLEAVARDVLAEYHSTLTYKFGTMIEVPRAALTAGAIAKVSDFFSFGTNDLTQMTYGISRDDAERGFLVAYQERGILPANPFHTLDRDGVGLLIDIAVQRGRSADPNLEIGICGEHGGDPESIHFCHELGLNYVSCSPFRVPVARLAAAHAALLDEQEH